MIVRERTVVSWRVDVWGEREEKEVSSAGIGTYIVQEMKESDWCVKRYSWHFQVLLERCFSVIFSIVCRRVRGYEL